MELERVFIIDFYLVFPSALSTIDFPKGFKKIKNVILNNNYSYREISNKYVTFQIMQPLQMQALDFLKSQGYIEINNLNEITKTSIFKNLKINLNLNFSNDLNNTENQLLINFFYKTSLNGANSLKKRTKLLEYRYD
ncbi:ABC-three component system middle component 5 [Acinetobacter radioresistens]|uniref:ABC-three component system middle component 5 n=1 Tax=Acinetobacter radioresistens TaxID=40216 RepID=UPI0031F40FCE